MAGAEQEPKEISFSYSQVLIIESGGRTRERKPLEVVRTSVGSLEVVLVVSGVLATAKVLHYLFGLIEEAYTIRPRIRKERAIQETDRLDAEVRGQLARQELIRLAAHQLDSAAPSPTSVDFRYGEDDEPPQLETAS